MSRAMLKKPSKIQMSRREFVREHRRLIRVLQSASHEDDKREAKEQIKELREKLAKSINRNAYIGPMSVADIKLASWNEFFREGGTLNQPLHLQTSKLKDIERRYLRLARVHSPL